MFFVGLKFSILGVVQLCLQQFIYDHTVDHKGIRCNAPKTKIFQLKNRNFLLMFKENEE